ncbi:carbonyl reductase [NADPH] 1 [Podospora conica]|nr:carbonyl reductase [NADPH] 1 [Schizothecium conicum]
MSYARVGVVTGANKGIGYAIVRQLALQYPSSPLNTGPLLIYLTARDPSRGETAVTTLTTQDVPLQQSRALRALGGLTDIKFHQLDISHPPSIHALAASLRAAHPSGIDFVINNAGTALDGFDINVVRTTLACNYHGTLAATRAFLPLLRSSGGRIVNVASTLGCLDKYSPAITARFLSATSVDDVTGLMDEFAAAVERGREKDEGWPSAAYATSKAGVIGMTIRIAAEVEAEGREGVLVNACCPGWVVTDMTKGRGHKTPDQGEREISWGGQ